MKLSAADTKRFLRDPKTDAAGFLVYGPDPLLVTYGRDRMIRSLLESDSNAAFERVPVEQVGSNRDFLTTMIKSQGFFAQRRVVCIDGAGEGIVQAVSQALESRGDEDGWLLLTAGQLRPASKLRKLFESSACAAALPIYDASYSPNEVRDALAGAGLRQVNHEAMNDLIALGRNLAPSHFAQTVEKLSLYKMGDKTPVMSEEVRECAPADEEVQLDELLAHVTAQRTENIPLSLRQVIGQGESPVTILILAQRRFRSLLMVASDPDGPAAGIRRLRPPVFGARQQQMIQSASRWGVRGARDALRHLVHTDRRVRSAGRVPAFAMTEGVLMRLSLMRLK